MKIGILTGGGDCPGLNAVIRAIVRKGTFHYNDEFMGFMEGWRGVLENMACPLGLDAVAGILPRGGTILRTSRTNPAKAEGGLERCIENIRKNGIEALIAIGGDDTQSVSQKLFERGLKLVGVPKTIDNDLSGTDFCFGFDTAVTIATEAIDRVHTTAEAHNRVIVLDRHEHVLIIFVRDNAERRHRSVKFSGGLHIASCVTIPNGHPVQRIVVRDVNIACRRINVNSASVFQVGTLALNNAFRLAHRGRGRRVR